MKRLALLSLLLTSCMSPQAGMQIARRNFGDPLGRAVENSLVVTAPVVSAYAQGYAAAPQYCPQPSHGYATVFGQNGQTAIITY